MVADRRPAFLPCRLMTQSTYTSEKQRALIMNLPHSKIAALPGDKKRRGAAIAEFAIVSPILALVLMGMIEVCRGTMVKVILSDAARKGCRTGIQRDKGNSDIIQDCTNIMSDNNLGSAKFNPSGGLGSITITVTDPNGSTLTESLDAPSGSKISVQVTIPVSSTTWVPYVFFTVGSLESETVVMMKQ
jgi:Flp pilus assembly protein TadG